jgi:hypothetical protein
VIKADLSVEGLPPKGIVTRLTGVEVGFNALAVKAPVALLTLRRGIEVAVTPAWALVGVTLPTRGLSVFP